MPAPRPCPDTATLEAFVRGRGPLDGRRAFERHLEGCPTCGKAAVWLLSHPTASIPASLAATAPPVAASGAGDGAELRQGDTVGRHIVIGRLGAGGMGTVYAAYDTALERKIALKFLSRTRTDEAAAARLLAEASAMARLNHPNVVTVHDVGALDGQPYLAMEYVNGETLGDWGRGRRRPVREILQVMAAVARGLQAAHSAGLIHRDVKPHNVLVAGERVLVTDFGLSVRANSDDHSTTGTMAGTPGYMAPEQLLGQAPTRGA
jgi:predicted Ser/Thr protein kinase